MPKTRQRRAPIVQLELRTPGRDPVYADRDRARGREVEPAATIADEPVSQQLQHRGAGEAASPPPSATRAVSGWNSRALGQPDVVESSYTISGKWCDFSPLANRTVARSSSSSKAFQPGFKVDVDAIAAELRRRQGGYGRGRRIADRVRSCGNPSGVRAGETIGGPIAMMIENRDWPNWSGRCTRRAEVPCRGVGGAKPRAGHSSEAGARRSGRRHEIRPWRYSRRPRAGERTRNGIARRCRSGGPPAPRARAFASPVTSGAIGYRPSPRGGTAVAFRARAGGPDDRTLQMRRPRRRAAMIEEIDRARENGDMCCGAFEVIATGVPIGLGSYIQGDRKLDGRLAQALMSIPAIKAVGVGLGPEAPCTSCLHSPRWYRSGAIIPIEIPPLARPTNKAGGLEGGVTNGEDLRVSAWMKPISMLMSLSGPSIG